MDFLWFLFSVFGFMCFYLSHQLSTRLKEEECAGNIDYIDAGIIETVIWCMNTFGVVFFVVSALFSWVY